MQRRKRPADRPAFICDPPPRHGTYQVSRQEVRPEPILKRELRRYFCEQVFLQVMLLCYHVTVRFYIRNRTWVPLSDVTYSACCRQLM